jgi:hypothetical protein
VTAHGRCGKCHALTEGGRQCSKPAKGSGKYCLTYHDESSKARSIAGSAGRPKQSGGGKNAPSAKRPHRTSNRGATTARTATSNASTGSPRPNPATAPTQSEKDQAAKLCADAIAGHEISQDFQDKITDIVSESVVERLTEKWDGKQCKKLAKSARRLLMTRSIIRQLAAYLVNPLMLALGYQSPARMFVCELVCRMPVPWYSKIAAAARVIQLSGICLCYANNRELTECECMIDLVRYEAKEGVGRLMTAGFDDWHEIAERVRPPTSALP